VFPNRFLPYASNIEFAWSSACAIGLVFALYRLWSAIGDDYLQRQRHEGKRVQWLSLGNVVQEAERCVVLTALVLAGMIGMATPAVRQGPPTRTGWAITIAFITVAITLVVGSIVGERIRNRVLSVEDE
jgi:hypothetical protein